MATLRAMVLLISAVLAGQAAWRQSAPAAETARYYVAFLRPDPARKALSKEEGERIQTAHMANIHKMADDGVLVSAGPFDDTPHTISGIFIFKVESLERAREIALKDPTVVEHRNTIDVHAWDGPARIGDEYFRLHKLDAKTPENMQIHPFCMLFTDKAADANSEVLAAHMRYVEKLRADGKLSAAGRVSGEEDLAGLVVFRVEYHQWWSADHVLPW